MINDDVIIKCFVVVVIVGFLASIIGGWIHTVVKRRKEYEKLDEPFEQTEVKSVPAEVMGKSSEIVQEGSVKQPKGRLAFFVTFKLKSGKVKKLEVGGGAFKRLSIGDKGVVHIEEGKYVGFDKDTEE